MAALALDQPRTPCPADVPRRVALVVVETTPADEEMVAFEAANDGQYPARPAYHYDPASREIRYEEYHPYGTSAYRAVDASVDVSAKRYRYTGMERDEETGLGYHSARYYAPWLGRWTASDPIGLGDGVNRYAYVGGRPISNSDLTGTSGLEEVEELIGELEFQLEEAYLNHGPDSPEVAELEAEIENLEGILAIHDRVMSESGPDVDGPDGSEDIAAHVEDDTRVPTPADQIQNPPIARALHQLGAWQARDAAAVRENIARGESGGKPIPGAPGISAINDGVVINAPAAFALVGDILGLGTAGATRSPQKALAGADPNAKALPSGATTSPPSVNTLPAGSKTIPLGTGEVTPSSSSPIPLHGFGGPMGQNLAAGFRWKGFSKGQEAKHFAKHGHEFGNISQGEYRRLAKEFAGEAGNFQEAIVGNFVVKYDPVTRRTLVGHTKDREIRTFYVADGRDLDPFISAVGLARQLGGKP